MGGRGKKRSLLPPPSFLGAEDIRRKGGKGRGDKWQEIRHAKKEGGGGGKWPSIHGVERGDARGGEL